MTNIINEMHYRKIMIIGIIVNGINKHQYAFLHSKIATN